MRPEAIALAKLKSAFFQRQTFNQGILSEDCGRVHNPAVTKRDKSLRLPAVMFKTPLSSTGQTSEGYPGKSPSS